MPLLDHFRSPPRKNFHWESFHSAWPNTIVRQLNMQWLPPRYRAMPQTHLGAKLEFDVGTFDEEPNAARLSDLGNGAAMAVWAPPQATMTVESDLDDPDIFEVQVVHLMNLMKQSGKAREWTKKNLYAVALRPRPPRKRRRFDVWPHELRLGERLPELPLWLSENLVVPLDLEASYEETCHVLRAR